MTATLGKVTQWEILNQFGIPYTELTLKGLDQPLLIPDMKHGQMAISGAARRGYIDDVRARTMEDELRALSLLASLAEIRAKVQQTELPVIAQPYTFELCPCGRGPTHGYMHDLKGHAISGEINTFENAFDLCMSAVHAGALNVELGASLLKKMSATSICLDDAELTSMLARHPPSFPRPIGVQILVLGRRR